MGIPVIKLNLVPAPSFWRRQHLMVGWAAIGIGAFALGYVGMVTAKAYFDTKKNEDTALNANSDMRKINADILSIQSRLKSIDVAKELPKWRLAERILHERSSPWSRMNAELERCLVQDVRVKSLIRSRGSDQNISIKLRGESRSAQAEAEFIEELQNNNYFAPVILDRETERQGGGMEFELILGISPVPPPYEPLPRFGPGSKKMAAQAAPTPTQTPTPAALKGKAPAPAQMRPQGLKTQLQGAPPSPSAIHQREARTDNVRQLRERVTRERTESPRKLPMREEE